ncbi:MAG: hypothetical protein BWY79_01206 [Actinobacteria bacterium ADurb.Bin444]|nr:MAG: hypothetical protein BWY79_01206 [Actinobacteria bacterium ADurb.Bin444]
MMTVRSISGFPVRGSSNSGNSRRVSTTSPARSPQAAMMTTSASAWRLVSCCNTVLPAPNGPGMQYVPPLATGTSVSRMRILVTNCSVGRNRSAYARMGRLTGHFCIMLTLCGPRSSSRTAISSATRYVPGSAILATR